jgi:predicted ATPase
MSHGESFFAALNAWLGAGLYLVGEPESALSPMRQLALLTRMNDLNIDESRFIVATHSPILLAYPDCWIYELSPKGIKRVTYEETEHYQVTRSFFSAPERFLRHLM